MPNDQHELKPHWKKTDNCDCFMLRMRSRFGAGAAFGQCSPWSELCWIGSLWWTSAAAVSSFKLLTYSAQSQFQLESRVVFLLTLSIPIYLCINKLSYTVVSLLSCHYFHSFATACNQLLLSKPHLNQCSFRSFQLGMHVPRKPSAEAKQDFGTTCRRPIPPSSCDGPFNSDTSPFRTNEAGPQMCCLCAAGRRRSPHRESRPGFRTHQICTCTWVEGGRHGGTCKAPHLTRKRRALGPEGALKPKF